MDNLTIMKFYRSHVRSLFFVMMMCTSFFTKSVFAEQYQLKLIADLRELNDTSIDSAWLEPLTSPINDGFFVGQGNGVIYLTGKDDAVHQDAVLNLSLSGNTPHFISLTAMALHPSFTMPERLGFGIFYTAHTTAFSQQRNNNRLTLRDPNIRFDFETVITAWKYDFDNQKIDVQSQREILRVPIQSKEGGIQQLAFSPYLKVWNADYGQLYFSLKSISELKGHALYSGAILRVFPQIFGARNYTVSRANPFVKNAEIDNEIVILGGHDIEHFFWAKNSHESIFIQHSNSELHWLSKAEVGGDLRGQSQPDYLWEQSRDMSSMLLYQGRNFLSLRNKMVFFTSVEQQWNLTSLPLKQLTTDSPIFEEVSATNAISPSATLNVYRDDRDEIIVFDTVNSQLYSLQSSDIKVSKIHAENSATAGNTKNASASEVNIYVLMAALLASVFVCFTFIRRKKGVRKLAIHSLNKTYVRFEYDLIKQAILLFRANKGKEHQSLLIKDVIRCEVSLNNKVINVFDREPENAISNQMDEQIRTFLTKAETDKMLEGQNRKIEVILSDHKSSYPICLYLRKGNTRLTGKSYSEIVDMLIELCWIISKRLNSHVTDSRIIPVTAFSQANYANTATQPDKPLATTAFEPSEDEAVPVVVPGSAEVNVLQGAEQDIDVVETNDVVDALDKLVALHKQGYLSDEEFALAKTKLLQ